jgi:hypothetical protein
VGSLQRLPAKSLPDGDSSSKLAVDAERASASVPPHVVARRGGVTQRVGGLGDAATFSPALAEVKGQPILVWAEGLGKTTRIRAARFDKSRLAITGPVTTVSAAGHEAGFASIGAFGERAVVTWEQTRGATWEIRVAEIKCM